MKKSDENAQGRLSDFLCFMNEGCLGIICALAVLFKWHFPFRMLYN